FRLRIDDAIRRILPNRTTRSWFLRDEAYRLLEEKGDPCWRRVGRGEGPRAGGGGCQRSTAERASGSVASRSPRRLPAWLAQRTSGSALMNRTTAFTCRR